jgi:hypothetical protein
LGPRTKKSDHLSPQSLLCSTKGPKPTTPTTIAYVACQLRLQKKHPLPLHLSPLAVLASLAVHLSLFVPWALSVCLWSTGEHAGVAARSVPVHTGPTGGRGSGHGGEGDGGFFCKWNGYVGRGSTILSSWVRRACLNDLCALGHHPDSHPRH